MYYLAAYPETIKPLLTDGKLPSKLPARIPLTHLYCTQTISDCLDLVSVPYNQTFVLELNLPSTRHHEQNHLFIDSINPACITRIFVYSQQAQNLLQQLLHGTCPKKIIIEPYVYPDATIEPEEALPLEPVNKKSKSAPSITTEQAPPVKRLATYLEHINFMRSALSGAHRNVLITSYDINHETLTHAGLYQIIPILRQRGVKIYIYYNDQKNLAPKIIDFFLEHNVSLQEAYTHSKLLAIDDRLAAIGSFNWLSGINPNYPESDEGSLVCYGDYCAELIQDFWTYLKHYRNLQFENYNAVDRFENNSENDSAITYELDDKTELTYLPTLNQHRDFFQYCFESAKKRLIICSPFISSIGEYADDLSHELLSSTVQRGVDIYFVCTDNSESIASFKAFLSAVSSPKINLITIHNIHLKTIIIDDALISEGSFNWLSAMRDDESDYHNHEQTLNVEGPIAKALIAQFFSNTCWPNDR